jgi:hypothetical protein
MMTLGLRITNPIPELPEKPQRRIAVNMATQKPTQFFAYITFEQQQA